MEIVIYFIIGIALLLIELALPGGVLGVIGYICIMWGIYEWLGETMTALWVILGLSIVLGAFMIIVVSRFPQTWLGKLFTLNTRFTKDKGYTSVDVSSNLVGCEGVAQTILRPAGRAKIDNRIVDVLSDGEFIEKGTPIRVCQVIGSRIIVRAK